MITKFKTFLVAGALIASLPLISSANGGGNNGGGGKGGNGSAPHDKVTLCHNGHSITISRSAKAAHDRNHGKNFPCYELVNGATCGSTTTPPPANCSPKPPKDPKPTNPCPGQEDNKACQ